MSAEQNLNPQDLELLSAYLDNMLNDAERSALEARLASDKRLNAELESLRRTVALIKGLPILKAPRSFMLTPEMVKSRTEAGAPTMVKSKTEPDAPRMVKSKTESGRIIRFPIPSVMSAAASFVFIIVGMILVFSSLNKPNSAFSPATGSNVAFMSTTIVPQQENQAETTIDDRAQLDRTDDVEQEAPDGINAQRAMMTPTLNTTTAGAMAMPTASQEPLLEISVESVPSNMPIPPSVDADLIQTQQAYAVVPAESLTLTETPSDMMMAVPMPTMSLTELPVTVMSVGTGDGTEEAMMDTAMTVASEETTPVTGFFEILGNAVPSAPSTIDVTQTISLPTPTVIPTIVIQEQATKTEDRSDVLTDITPFAGVGLIALGFILFIIVIWRGVRGRVS